MLVCPECHAKLLGSTGGAGGADSSASAGGAGGAANSTCGDDLNANCSGGGGRRCTLDFTLRGVLCNSCAAAEAAGTLRKPRAAAQRDCWPQLVEVGIGGANPSRHIPALCAAI